MIFFTIHITLTIDTLFPFVQFYIAAQQGDNNLRVTPRPASDYLCGGASTPHGATKIDMPA
jgi:hypothetical protein